MLDDLHSGCKTGQGKMVFLSGKSPCRGEDTDYSRAGDCSSGLDGRFHSYEFYGIFRPEDIDCRSGGSIAGDDDDVRPVFKHEVRDCPGPVYYELPRLVPVWTESIVRPVDIVFPGENPENLPEDGKSACPGVKYSYCRHWKCKFNPISGKFRKNMPVIQKGTKHT